MNDVRVVHKPRTAEGELIATRAFSAGERVLVELAHVSVGLTSSYAYGTYVWDLVAALLHSPDKLHAVQRWQLKTSDWLVASSDELAETLLVREHRKSRQLVHQLFLTVATNNVGQLDAQGRVRGHGLYELLSRCDHSCDPNTRLVPGDALDVACLRANRDIAEGEPLTWSYFEEEGFLPAPYVERNLALMNHHRFVCRCARCARECPENLRALASLEAYFDGRIDAQARVFAGVPAVVA